ncbi:MAG: hypothetical protein H0U23_10135, partial [Blastocatellia bacterium]|nr:hypothetical protein [Blastocatellia bacterium]
MREIKFRLWHREQKMMWRHELLWGSPSQHGSGWLRCVPFNDSLKHSFLHDGNDEQVDPNECEIMQFVGLRDKSGVEIYEGDIGELNDMFTGAFKVEVVFDNGAFGVM